MRILYIADIYEIGGAVNCLKDIIEEALERSDITPVVVVSKKGIISALCEEKGIECCIAGHRQFLVNAGSTLPRKLIRIIFRPYLYLRYKICNFLALWRIERDVDLSSIDIVHTNTERNDVGAYISRKHNIPHVWHIRVYGDLDYDVFSMKTNLINFMNHYSDRLIMISKGVANHWIKKGVDPRIVDVVYDGIDFEKFSYAKYNAVQKFNKTVNLVIVGFISRIKGQYQIIQAIAGMTEKERDKIHLDIYGKGAKEYILQLLFFIRKHHLEKYISFKGQKQNIQKHLKNYDIGLTCSRSEAFGLVTVEYMASGLAVIGSNTGANVEIIENDFSGLLYKYGDIDDLKNKILRLVEDSDTRSYLAENGMNVVKSKYTRHKNVASIFEVYKKITKTDEH